MNAIATAVVEEVCDAFHVKPEALYGPAKILRISWPRQVAMFLLREDFGLTYRDTAAVFGRTHSTAVVAAGLVRRRIATVREDRQTVEDVRAALAKKRLALASGGATDSSRNAIAEAIRALDAEIANAYRRRSDLAASLALLNGVAA